MLKVAEIRELIRLVDQSNINEFTYEFEGLKLEMKKSTTGREVVSVPVQTVTVQPQETQVQAPVVHVAPKAEPEIKQQQPVEKVVSEQSTDNLHKITSPMVGTFYQAPSPGAEPYVKVGSKVSKDSVVCIVEAMKLFNEIEAEVDGEIVEILVKDGQLVEYGQPLFLVKAN